MELVSCKNKIESQHMYLLQHWRLEIQPKVKRETKYESNAIPIAHKFNLTG